MFCRKTGISASSGGVILV